MGARRRNERAAVAAVAGLLLVAGVTAALAADPVETDVVDFEVAPYDPAGFPDRNVADAIASAMGDDTASERLIERLTPFAATGITPASFEDVQALVAGSRIEVDGVLVRDDDELSVLATGRDELFAITVTFPAGAPDRIDGLLFSPAPATDDGPLSDVEAVLIAAAMLALVVTGLLGSGGRWHWVAGLVAGLALLERASWEPAQSVAIVAVPIALAVAVAAAPGRARPWWLLPAALLVAAVSVLPVMSVDPGGGRPFGHLVAVESLVGHTRGLQQAAAVVALFGAVAAGGWFTYRAARTDRRGDRWELVGGAAACAVAAALAASGLLAPARLDLTTTGWAAAALLAVAAGRGGRLLQRHADVAGIAATVADLATGRSTDLTVVLARALDDPTVAVLHAHGDGFVDRDGRPATLPADPARSTSLVLDGELVGAIVHDPAVGSDAEHLRAACDAVKLSLANERLTAQIRARLDDVRASRQRLLHAEEQARRRIERDLHDGAQQRLTAATLALRMVQSSAATTAPELAARLDPIGTELQRAVEEIRELARGVRPAALDGGIAAAVEDLAERAALPVTVDNRVQRRLGDDVETAAYFVVSEALTNATRHAAASHVLVTLHDDGPALRVTVRDDGRGVAFEVAPGERPIDVGTTGTGLVGLFDRLDAHGGTLAVRRHGDGGTIVEAVVPCAP